LNTHLLQLEYGLLQHVCLTN